MAVGTECMNYLQVGLQATTLLVVLSGCSIRDRGGLRLLRRSCPSDL